MGQRVMEACMTKSLPAQFSDLAGFTEKWLLPQEAQRHSCRLAAPLEELKSLYDAMLPRMDEIIGYLDRYDIKSLNEENRNLLTP